MRSHDATTAAVAGALYERYAARVHRLCARRLGDDEAADAVQDTFLRAWLALRDGADVRHPLPWLLTIADNVCVSRFRARGARIVTTELQESAGVEPSAPSGEVESLTAALRGLPDTQRQALLRRELQGFSYDEIGAELGVSRASVAALLHRARHTVAESLRGARRGFPAIAPIPVFRAIHMGNVGGVAAAGSTAAVAVTVAQLAGPAPAAVPETPRAHAALVEVVSTPRSTGLATSRVRPGPRQRVKRVARATVTVRVRTYQSPPASSPKGQAEVFVWHHPLPRTSPHHDPTPLPPSDEGPGDEGPGDEGPGDTMPMLPPVSPPEADEPDYGAGVTDGAEAAAAVQADGGEIEAGLDLGDSNGNSGSAPGHGGQPPGIGASGPPRGGSAGSGNGHGSGGAAGPPPHPSQAGESGGNGPPSAPGNGTSGRESPVGGSEPGGQPVGNGSGPPHGGGGDGGRGGGGGGGGAGSPRGSRP